MKVYTINRVDYEWQDIVAIKSNKEQAVKYASLLAQHEKRPDSIEVWEYEVDGKKTKQQVFP